MTMFRVGDRIVVKSKGIIDAKELRNCEGIILRANLNGSITVAFFDWNKGHSGSGTSAYPHEVHQYMTPKNVWHCNADEVELCLTAEGTTLHPDNLKYLAVVRKVQYLNNKFNNRKISREEFYA